MIPRSLEKRPTYVYPPDEWRMVEKRFYPRFLDRAETFFSIANGYLGMRGNFEEGDPAFENGTFVNGLYESWPIIYGEDAYGFAKTGQTILNVIDAKVIRLYVDDEPFFIPTATLGHYERVLDMQQGFLDRDVLWRTAAGKEISIKSRRLISFQHRHVAAISYEVTVLNADAPVVISSEMLHRPQARDDDGDPRRARGLSDRALLPRLDYARDLRAVLSHQTRNSGMTVACGADHSIETECAHSHETECSPDQAKLVVSADAKPGVPIRITKYITYHTSRFAPNQELCERAERSLDRAVSHGFEELVVGQRQFMDEFWSRSDVQVEDDAKAQQAIRFNLFHMLQASARAEGVGLPAKGLTGSGYEGHYFWDTEIYVLPFLIYTAPRVARNLLTFRRSNLEKARDRAKEMSQKGALFPWRTINGEEASAYYAAGTAQYHINADIMYALRKYVHATGDIDFLHGPGVRMLVETARMWRDLGFFNKRRDGKFCIHGVTGPDEYNTVVNNNTFTNLMARENLWFAASTVRGLQEEKPERYAELASETELGPSEVEDWQRAADLMYVPYDEDLGIHPQDDEFLNRKPWDFENTPPEKYPLLLHHHPLVIYRHQVIKQADVVLAMFLLGNEFTPEEKKRNYDFYDPLTTGDSSLSVSIQAIIAAELGYADQAQEYARYALLMDLADVGGNVKDGCHIASMGGTWMAVVYGLAGFRDYDGIFTFKPRAPRKLGGVRFRMTLRGSLLEVAVSKEATTYTLHEGEELTIFHGDEEIRLSSKSPVVERAHAATTNS